MKGALNGLLALVSLILAAGSFYMYTRGAGGVLWLILMLLFGLGLIVFGGMFLSGKVNKTEEIHITE